MIVFYIGDLIKYNLDIYVEFNVVFEVIWLFIFECERNEFICVLKEKRWGYFSVIFCLFWGIGGEMGWWDVEFIDLLFLLVKVFVSVGVGFDWVDIKFLGERGVFFVVG